MRTVNDVIKYVNDIKPNAFTDETLTEWLSECEGSIQTEILCIASGDVVTYSYADNKDTELIVKPPHDKLYGFYLLAMIDFAHGEYKKYENTMQLFNAALSEFAKWFVRTHSKEAKNPEGYYMSGYDLAVKHGYSGTEEEWLKTLIGPQGVQGIQGEKGDRGIPGKIQSVTSGDNGKILVDGESVVVYDDSEIKEEIGGKVDKAIGKGLSSNDYTDAEKNKLANLSNYDDTEIKNEIGGKVDKVQGKGLSSNDYTAEEKTKLSELPTKTELDTDLSGKEDSANKVTTLDENSTDDQYPSAKCMYDTLRYTKVDKEDGKGLSTNDYTNEEMGKVAKINSIEEGLYDTRYNFEKLLNDFSEFKESSTTAISGVTGTSPSIMLADNTEFHCSEIKSLTINIPPEMTEYRSLICSIVFTSGNTATVISNPDFQYFEGYYQGTDCKNGVFLPKANKRYTLIITYTRGYGQYGVIDCYISAVPIQTVETQSADDFPAANDESVAEPTESVAEEPESEPNEVI